jgi:hypothetical protein
MRLKRDTWLIGASVMPYGSGLTIAGQMKYVKTRSVQIAFTYNKKTQTSVTTMIPVA